LLIAESCLWFLVSDRLLIGEVANFQALVMHQRSAIREVPAFAGRGSTSRGTSAEVVRCLWEGVASERVASGRASAARRIKNRSRAAGHPRTLHKRQYVLKLRPNICVKLRKRCVQARVAASRQEAAMWWRMTKTIIISWLVGVICGVGMVVVLQQEHRVPLAESTSSQLPAQTTGMAPDNRN
jgi:hypothetical protein